ncbi:adenosylcobinamide amidohydrolase [Paracoccus sp. 11-3]|uniref:Adenosylcobinamide amidohydrolase n=1 Tax=Paracoccus amoyensis TaxID=2760093 RepID=A0A926JDQ6_9RHOB|nr:adenosylcobinamide amidohydrolase [Paracoccus amoyensis]MBC9247944.1 adenosylcobinamide amidohydrolase [Paracoccus amoyensis]
MKTILQGAWLIADLGRPMQVLSFAPYRPGFRTADRVLIRYVRNADLGPKVDALGWLAAQIHHEGWPTDVAMLTSRELQHYRSASQGLAHCVATVGLGNAERIGQRRVVQATSYGTINIILRLQAGLSQTAMLEAMTLMAEARTAAIMDAGLKLPLGAATGTGTDCLALACDPGDQLFVGKHTDLGQMIGGAVYDAVSAGAQRWILDHGDRLS